MLRFVLRRLGLMVPTLLGLSLLLFFWVRILPGDPARSLLGQRATPEAIERLNDLYGFDEPIWRQYLTYMGALLRGDFGQSIDLNGTSAGRLPQQAPRHDRDHRRGAFVRDPARHTARLLCGAPRGRLAGYGDRVRFPAGSRDAGLLPGHLVEIWSSRTNSRWLPTQGRLDASNTGRPPHQLLCPGRPDHRRPRTQSGMPCCTWCFQA
ncbi:MAG: ABC transporter permease [Nocardioidaceae bacterium]